MMEKCPKCNRRRARRTCPALGEMICTVCCGTKRVTEINSPEDCSYLITSHSHPPAALQKQRTRDLNFLLPLLQGMTEQQQSLMIFIQGCLRRDRPDEIAMTDSDIEQSVRAVAETYETASRGIIYEHSAGVAAAERLSSELRTIIEKQRTEGLRISDGEVAEVLRRTEAGLRKAQSSLPGDDTAYLELLKRVLTDEKNDSHSTDGLLRRNKAASDSGLILPS